MSLSLLGRGVLPTVKVSQRVVRFGGCPCYDRRDVVVGINNTGELPIRCLCVCVRFLRSDRSPSCGRCFHPFFSSPPRPPPPNEKSITVERATEVCTGALLSSD